MAFILFVDSSTSVEIEPDYQSSEQDSKIEDVHRTRSGGRYHYKWGDYFRRMYSVSFVDSAFKSRVNDWWNENTALLFMEDGSTQVHSVRIVNIAQPIGGYIAPYDDLFTGTIELESY